MKHILVPTDFSDNAYSALSYVRLLLQDEEVIFTLYHAYEPSPILLLGKSPYRVGAIYNSCKKVANEKIEQLLTKINGLNENQKHTYETISSGGALEEAIKAIDIDRYDFIAMGSKGATGLKTVFWGSNTFSLVNMSLKKPILIIPENSIYKNPEKIAFATNFTRSYLKEELQTLIEITQKWNASLRVIEVYYDPILTEEQQEHLETLENLLIPVASNFHVIPHFNTVEKAITIFNKELEIDMLAMINYPKSLFQKIVREPIIKKMVHHTTIPFLVLPSLTD
ncbi:universal stress protein [uncultured Dokdonia sp.]|uniref:universal stress protein n=1 Tax=uncultured Dokdonia sp. TaxID=575653 RepID=UPI0026292599|nr:universal stress protein [uncultured Dokdonia sp.]